MLFSFICISCFIAYSHHPVVGKVSRAGLFSSTLSSRYDAHTTDSTWVCVFCKQGPHSIIPGDPSRPHPNLAGPHIATGTYTVGILIDIILIDIIRTLYICRIFAM